MSGTITVDPRARFLRVVRTLTLISGVMTPVTLGAVMLAGCGGNVDTDPTTQGGGIRAYDGGDDVADALPDVPSDVFTGGTSPGPDTGHDAFDGVDAGISIGDTADADDASADAEIGIGGPLVAPEMPEELAA